MIVLKADSISWDYSATTQDSMSIDRYTVWHFIEAKEKHSKANTKMTTD